MDVTIPGLIFKYYIIMKPLRSILSHPDISGFTVFQRTVVYVLAFLVFMLLPVYFIFRRRIFIVYDIIKKTVYGG